MLSSVLAKRRVAALFLVIAAFGAVGVPAALPWGQEYVGLSGQWFPGPGTYTGSAYNTGVNYNVASWTANIVGDDAGLTLCDGGGACYSPVYISSGTPDTRSISYGNAWCGGDYRNTAYINVDYCVASN